MAAPSHPAIEGTINWLEYLPAYLELQSMTLHKNESFKSYATRFQRRTTTLAPIVGNRQGFMMLHFMSTLPADLRNTIVKGLEREENVPQTFNELCRKVEELDNVSGGAMSQGS